MQFKSRRGFDCDKTNYNSVQEYKDMISSNSWGDDFRGMNYFIFYSGNRQSGLDAKSDIINWRKDHPDQGDRSITLEETTVGRELQKMEAFEQFSRKEMDKLWILASAKYADACLREQNSRPHETIALEFTRNAQPERTFLTIEKPMLDKAGVSQFTDRNDLDQDFWPDLNESRHRPH